MKLLFEDQNRKIYKEAKNGKICFIKSCSNKSSEEYKLLLKDLIFTKENKGKHFISEYIGESINGSELFVRYKFLDTIEGKSGFFINTELQGLKINADILAEKLIETSIKFSTTLNSTGLEKSKFCSKKDIKSFLSMCIKGQFEYPHHRTRSLSNVDEFLNSNGLSNIYLDTIKLLEKIEFTQSSKKFPIHGDLQLGYLNPYHANKPWTGNVYYDLPTNTVILIDYDWSEYTNIKEIALSYDIGFLLLSAWSNPKSKVVISLIKKWENLLSKELMLDQGSVDLKNVLRIGLLLAFWNRFLPRIIEYSKSENPIFVQNYKKRLSWAKVLFKKFL